MPPTDLLFRDDAYLAQHGATVICVNERGAIILDRTAFYANGGGQPGDAGALLRADGSSIAIGAAEPRQTAAAVSIFNTRIFLNPVSV
jgi:misacylated tRNA(Ala) deacylase